MNETDLRTFINKQSGISHDYNYTYINSIGESTCFVAIEVLLCKISKVIYIPCYGRGGHIEFSIRR